MHQAGMFGNQIAFNEHGIAPATSALAKRDGAADEKRRNRNAARKRRVAGAPKGPRQPPAAPVRRRTLARELRRNIKSAMRQGKPHLLARYATELKALFAQPGVK